jgi:hypothetical protein
MIDGRDGGLAEAIMTGLPLDRMSLVERCCCAADNRRFFRFQRNATMAAIPMMRAVPPTAAPMMRACLFEFRDNGGMPMVVCMGSFEPVLLGLEPGPEMQSCPMAAK